MFATFDYANIFLFYFKMTSNRKGTITRLTPLVLSVVYDNIFVSSVELCYVVAVFSGYICI